MFLRRGQVKYATLSEGGKGATASFEVKFPVEGRSLSEVWKERAFPPRSTGAFRHRGAIRKRADVGFMSRSQALFHVLFASAFVVLGLLAGPAAHAAEHKDAANRDPLIVVHCSLGLLQVWHGSQLTDEYPAEIGRGGLDKRRSGDHKTPLGNYEISWMASRARDKGHRVIHGKSWCEKNRFVHADRGSPVEKLWSLSYGGRQSVVMSINYPNERDAAQGRTGNCIHIHATKHLRDGSLTKSLGCIHLFPKDALELYDAVEVGTPVKILP